MIDTTSRILWGPTLDNVFDVGWPLRAKLPRRKWRTGSRLDRFPSGAQESIVTGRDYALAVEAPWLPQQSASDNPATTWSGPLGVDAFLAWCEDGNTFRFVPDINSPLAYADGCVLQDPANAMPRAEDDGTFTLPLTILNPTIDLHLLMRGLLFEYVPGQSLTDPVTITVTRADPTTCATYVDRNGLLQLAAANVLRDTHYANGRRAVLVESQRINLVLHSNDVTAGNGWTLGGSVAGTAAYVTLGVLPLTRLTSLTSGPADRAVTITGDGVKAVSGVVMFDGVAGKTHHGLYDATAMTFMGMVEITWASDGTATCVALVGTLCRFVALARVAGCSAYRWEVQSASCTAAHSHAVYATDSGSTTATSIRVGAMQVEDAPFPSSIIMTAGGAVTRAADAVSVTVAFGAQDFTVEVEVSRPGWASLSGDLNADEGLLSIGYDGVSGVLLYGRVHARNWGADIGGQSASAAIPAGASLTVGAQYRYVTDVTARVDVGSGFGSSSPATTHPAFGTALMRLGSYGAGNEFNGEVYRIRVALGLRLTSQVALL